MDIYYIMTMESFFKSYYTEQGDVSFSTSIRKAVSFVTIESATQMIKDMKLENCYVINQFGQEQK